jgi:hypothetical protein
MEPIVERLSQQGFAVTKVDIKSQPNLMRKYSVTETPHSIIVAGDKIYSRQSGIIAYEKLAAAMKQAAQRN